MSTDLSGRMFERQGNHFVPCDFMAEEFVQSLPEGKKVLLDFKKPRSPENHAHFFALLHKALEHLQGFEDEEALLDCIKIAVGHTRPVMLRNGDVAFLPKSIRFAAMPEDQFKRFKDRALYVLSELLGFDAITLLPEIDKANRRNR